MLRTTLILATLAAGTLAGPAWSQAAFPTRPVTLVVPFSAGGGTDTLARTIALAMGERLKQTVVVDNKPGAGTELGATLVSRAPADGYTLLISSNSTYTINPALKPKLQYSADKSFEAIGLVGSSPLVIMARPPFAASTVPQLVAIAKATPGKLSYASYGAGTTSHLAGEMLKSAAGINLLHVPYKGSGPAMSDFLGGQVDLDIDTIVASVPMIRSGKAKALATTGAKRSALLPNVATVAEAGYPSYEMSPWIAIVAPRGLPEAVKQRLSTALSESLADAAVKKRLLDTGIEVNYQPPVAYDARVAKELPLLRAFVAKTGITLD